ncbi:MAG: PilZ domain-containing protein [Bryobacteraceae bacterium]
MPVIPISVQPFNVYMFSVERRSRQRFPLALAVEYRLLGPADRCGSGWTCNISSTGVLFEVAEREPLSGPIELMMSWPCVLDGACALKLVVKGRVVRHEGRGIAIASTQHEFRTAGPANGAKRLDLRSQIS